MCSLSIFMAVSVFRIQVSVQHTFEIEIGWGASHFEKWWLLNPKGIVSFSPRLRGTSYLGHATPMNATPTGLWPGDDHQRRNPVGVVIFSRRLTQGGSFLATLGFAAESL